MGQLVTLPRDFDVPVVETWFADRRYFLAQFEGFLCPHYHRIETEAERCARRMVRVFNGRRPPGKRRVLHVLA